MPRSLSILLIALALGNSSATAQEQPPRLLPTPAEHVPAVELAQNLGRALFVKYWLAREAEELIATEFGPDAAISGWLALLNAQGLRVRFLGGEGESPRVLYQVDYLGRDPQPPVRFDPPASLEPGEADLWRAKLTAAKAAESRCDGVDYTAIVAPLEISGGPTLDVYLLAASTPDVVRIAGHTRVRVAPDGRSVQEVVHLSNSCLALEPESGREPVVFVATHLLTSVPNEAHVFVSLLHQKPIVVGTEAGNWFVARGGIGYVGPRSDEECCEETLAETGLPAKPVPRVPPDWRPPATEARVGAPWEERLVLWRDFEDESTPWQSDERFEGQFAPDYPNDLAVYFLSDRGELGFEVMWVRLFGFHEASDRYLGHLLNQPSVLQGVDESDNVVVVYDSRLERPIALSRNGDFAAPGLPEMPEGGVLERLYAGVRHYRRGPNGNDPEVLDACIATLGEVIPDLDLDVLPEHRYVAHYILGRCLAEKYETAAAIEQFEGARELRPEALDPNMALLAQYLINLHQNKDDPSFESTYLQQLELVRDQYCDNERVAIVLGMLFDEDLAGDMSSLPPEEIERRRRIGFGAFRWKVPD